MRAVRLYMERHLAPHDEIRLDEATRHHAVNVLHLHRNSPLTLFNGDGHDYACVILALNRKDAVVKVTGQKRLSSESALATHLVVGVSKSLHIDYAIQKAVEAGVTNLHPVITQRTVVKLSSESRANKRRHWQRIITSACEQCGRAVLPTLHDVIDLPDLQALDDAERGFVLDTESDKALADFGHERLTTCWLLVGPEGGLTQNEVNEIRQKGYQGASLGPRVLRTETAAASAIICAQLLWGDLSKKRDHPCP